MDEAMNPLYILGVPLGYVMEWIYKLIPNYGWDIILFTLLINIVKTPLQLNQQKNTVRMSAFQPMIADIQKKYKDKPEKQNEEIMKLQQDFGYNPMSGCAPMLINFLVMFGVIEVVYRPLQRIFHIGADAITAAYQKADPSHKDDYAKLNKEWHAKEDQLESKIKETSAKTEGLPYAATESVAWYLADDLKMTDATPKGYAQASANESEPTPADIKDFQDTLKAGFIKMFVFNSQEANSTTDQITGAAKDANVPIVELAEQMPKQYTNLLDWMSALVDQFAAAVK